ncbi:hypothetical protein JCM10908_000229 [Rhodotorula pacifica]|uniref:DEAD/DEAH box helicase n=1 Tax=Rhodotorula pacifica TaxID=1495444 RepID=UPI00317C6059
MDSEDVKPTIEREQEPVASTSRIADVDAKPRLGSENTLEDDKSAVNRSPTPDRKGKGKASAADVQMDDSDGATAQRAEDDKLAQAAEDPNEEILFHTLTKANIVGVAYAGGVRSLKEGMELDLRRDPYNVTDKNAIEVRHSRGQRVGYVAKVLAERLTPLLKERRIRLAAVAGPVPANTVGVAKVPMRLEIHGKRKYATDSRLDWCFPDRLKAKQEAEKKRKEQQALEQKLTDRENERWTGGAANGKKGGRSGQNGSGGGGSGGGGGGGGPGGDASDDSHDDAPPDSLLEMAAEMEKTARPDLIGDLFKVGALDPALLPGHPCPPGKDDGSMKSNLLPFQRQGLAWMIRMEHPQLPKTFEDAPVQLWAKRQDTQGGTYWLNTGTEETTRDTPKLKRGGILADEMGLGKTMQTIALICTDDTGEGVLEDGPEEPDERYDDMTLIVCPLSVAANWTEQLQQHVGKKRLKWHMYHGEGRDVSKRELRKYDVVISTYQTLAGSLHDADSQRSSRASSIKNELENAEEDDEDALHPAKKQKIKKDSVLHSIKWRRVVLDEGHLVKNPKAKMSRACAELKAERRWILTGTPILNSAADLGAMLCFLKLCKPLDEPEKWRQYVSKASDEKRAKLLRAIVLSTTLRRTKDMVDTKGKPLITLPELTYYKHEVELQGEPLQLYQEVEAEISSSVKKAMKDKDAKPSVTRILCLLLRLRQIACDPSLCPPDFIADMRDRKLAVRIQQDHDAALGVTSGKLGAEQLPVLRSLLQEMTEAGADCLACQQWAVDPRITICQHFFCQSCIESAVDAKSSCPYCGLHLSRDHVIAPMAERSVTPSTNRSSSVSRNGSVALPESSAKTAALIKLLKASAPGVKSLVFSQWTGHLDRIEAALHEEGISTCRFDGSMRQEKREAVVKSFTSPNKTAVAGSKEDRENPMVMLLSLQAGALGLNLTVASQVFMMDPWWQPAIEAQAIDRVNRIGQTKPVRVFQIVAKHTVEDRVLAIQAKKEAVIAQAFSGHKNVSQSKAKIEITDLASIFGLSDGAA